MRSATPGVVHGAHRVAAADDREAVAVGDRLARRRTCPRRSAAIRRRPSGRSRTRCAPRRSAARSPRASAARCRARASRRAGRRTASPASRRRRRTTRRRRRRRGSTAANEKGFSTRTSSAIFPPISTASARAPRFSSTPTLSSTFAPPETITNGRSTSPSSAPRCSSSSSSSRPAYAGSSSRDADRRGVRAVRRAECVVHVEVAALGELAGEALVVLRLARDRSACSRARWTRSSATSSASRSRTGAIENFGAVLLGLRPAEVRADAHLRAPAVEQQPERRQRGADARVVGDAAVLERDVEVRADEDDLARRRRRTRRTAAVSQAPSRRDRRAGTSSPTRCRTSRRPSRRCRSPSSARCRTCTTPASGRCRSRRAARSSRRGTARAARSAAAAAKAALTSSTRRLARASSTTRSVIEPVGDGSADGDAVDLALQVREHEADRPRGAGRGRDQVDRGRPRAAQVLVREVEHLLVVRVRVDRRHEAVLDPEARRRAPSPSARRSSSCTTRWR